jgi:acetyl-CoA carboxylase biotin carboxyl carrier protein
VALRYDEIADILKLIDSSSCEELIIETGDIKLVVRRGAPSGTIKQEATPISAPRAAPVAPPAPAPLPSSAAKITEKAAHQVEILAPMVGTFYSAPAPGAPPFVEIGSAVRKGDPLCMIEVMKLFTTITSEHDGRIVQIGADNAELVEYGRTLFVIEPA